MAKSFSELILAAAEIRDETAQGENTAARVGGLLAELVEYLRISTLAEGVSATAESGRVLLRFARHDAEGTAFFEDVILEAADEDTAGIMSAEQAELLETHSSQIDTLDTALTAVKNKLTSQGNTINSQAQSLANMDSRLAADETKIAANATAAASAKLAADTAHKAATAAQTTADAAKTLADTNKMEIGMLQSYTTELGEDRDNLLATTAGLYVLGSFSSSDDAYAKLATAEIAGDEDKRVIFFTVGTAYNGVVVQTVENDYCKQFIAYATHYYFRAIYFTDGERTATSYVEPLRYAFGDRLSWNADSHKLLLSQFGAPFNEDCTDAIPTATNERDGLMTADLVQRLELLEKKVAAFHPLGN